MKAPIYKLTTYLSTVVLWWYWIFAKRNPKIYSDIDRALESHGPAPFKSYFLKFCYAMNFLHEFTAVFYLRIGRIRFLRPLLFWFYRPDPTVMIHLPEKNVGEGLKIVHGFSIICIAQSVGKNCSIFQQVTIGFSHGACPVIGDNVSVYAGAKVLGGVSIGNNAVVAANAVVVKDVPENAIVAGVPAKVIGYRKTGEFVM